MPKIIVDCHLRTTACWGRVKYFSCIQTRIMKRIILIAIIILRKSLVRRLKWSATIDINTELTQLPHIEENPIHPAVAWNRVLEFLLLYWKFPMMLIQHSVEIWLAVWHSVNSIERFGWYRKIMRRQLWILTCPIRFCDVLPLTLFLWVTIGLLWETGEPMIKMNTFWCSIVKLRLSLIHCINALCSPYFSMHSTRTVSSVYKSSSTFRRWHVIAQCLKFQF